MHQHFVTFYSPGTFFAEDTTKPIDAWSTETAQQMAAEIVERYGARPFGFRFMTRSREDDDLDSRVTATSSMHYLGGTIETIEEVNARNDPSEEILRFNMRANGYNRIIRGASPWQWVQPLGDDDVVLAK